MTFKELKIQIGRIVADTLGAEIDIERFDVNLAADPKFGDYATNAAMVYAKGLGRAPREVAELLAAAIRDASPNFAQVAVAGPGFINITLTDTAVSAAAKSAAEFVPHLYDGQLTIMEYSDPNPFKPLHAGHLYTTLVGDVVSRLLERGGAKVIRLTYGGDVGLHVARSMWGIIQTLGGELPDKLADIAVDERAQWLGRRYVEGTTAYEDDETARAEIITMNKRVYDIHSSNDHDSAFAQIYWTGRKWSYDYFPELYRQLGVTPFDRTIPESEVTPLGLATVLEQQKVGIYEDSNGAVVFRGEPYGLHTRVFINSQGLPTYESKDVGLLLTKWHDYNFDRSIVVTAVEQEQYMAVMLKSVEQFAPEPAQRSLHLTHGMVKLVGGLKMSSRKGNVVAALDILEAAHAAAEKLSKASADKTVVAAVKYAFLKQRIGGDILYDPEESVSLDGNSGPYLQYAHARARSILAKAANAKPASDTGEWDQAERTLARKIAEYAEVIDRSVSELRPHYICTYLYELAQVFNRFYERSRVISDPREAQRIFLVERYAAVLADGLGVLGMAAPESM